MNNNARNNRNDSNPAITRLETILKTLVSDVTRNLDLTPDTFNERVEKLSKRLANEGTIVMVADIPNGFHGQHSQIIQEWVNTYARLYYLLSEEIFETVDEPVAYIADNKYPVIVVFKARMLVVTRVLSGLIIPYIAKRQEDGSATRAELRGMIELILEELSATNLEYETYMRVRNGSLQLLETLLKLPMIQGALTDFNQPFVIETGGQQTRIEGAPKPDSIAGLPNQKPNTIALGKPTPDKILKMPSPENKADSGTAIPAPPSMLDRVRRSR